MIKIDNNNTNNKNLQSIQPAGGKLKVEAGKNATLECVAGFVNFIRVTIVLIIVRDFVTDLNTLFLPPIRRFLTSPS